MKFRIVKVENGYYRTKYIVQEKFLWFFWANIQTGLTYKDNASEIKLYHYNPFYEKEDAIQFIEEYKKYLKKEELKQQVKITYMDV